MTKSQIEAEEALLLEIASSVEALLKRAPRGDWGYTVGMGADGTPTKVVDALAEEEMMRVIEQAPIPVNVLSEEIGFVDNGADVTLVADPVDGTTNAVKGIPLYCVSLAIGTRSLSDVHLALVRNVPTGDTYIARRGKGAFLNGHPLATRPFHAEEAVISPNLGKNANREALYLASQRYYVRTMGSAALEMCFVAQGALDLYYFAPEKLRVTDIAASTLIVREAGGRVLNAAGEELDVPLSLAPRTSVVAAASDDALEMLEVFR